MIKYEYQPTGSEINRAGHADNVEIYRWFNDQRLALFDAITSQSSVLFVPPYVKTELQFKREVFDHGPITIKTSINHIGNRSFSAVQTLEQDGELCAECETVAVNFCVETQKPLKIDDNIRAALERFRAP